MRMGDTVSDTPDVWAALLTAQAAMAGVPKTGRNTAQGWAYVEAAQVIRAAREALTGAGLVAVLTLEDYDPHILSAVLIVNHPASGTSLRLPMPWPIERPGPQGLRAAHTYALKQALLELLLVGDDDPEQHATPAPPDTPRPTRRGTTTAADKPTQPQTRRMWQLVHETGMTPSDARRWMGETIGRDITSSTELDRAEVSILIDRLEHRAEPPQQEEDTP
jgi:hypothetical protein